MARVLILLGSSSDREHFEGTEALAAYFNIEIETAILSAHRNSERLREKLAEAAAGDTQIIIAAAGMAAHLAGVCAAESNLPVIGVPLPGSSLGGLDALLSTVQMPSGIPVATVAIGKAGAKNAIVLAARILALQDPAIAVKLAEFKDRGSRL
jgi:5-(carboxyamino)imidazole ribonucleotide mutase